MFHNISNPKWFGNWSRLEDDYLGNGGTDIADNFTFSKMEKTGGLFGSIIRLATAFPACGGNLVTWHPGELHLTREDVRKPPALQKDISIAT